MPVKVKITIAARIHTKNRAAQVSNLINFANVIQKAIEV